MQRRLLKAQQQSAIAVCQHGAQKYTEQQSECERVCYRPHILIILHVVGFGLSDVFLNDEKSKPSAEPEMNRL